MVQLRPDILGVAQLLELSLTVQLVAQCQVCIVGVLLQLLHELAEGLVQVRVGHLHDTSGATTKHQQLMAAPLEGLLHLRVKVGGVPIEDHHHGVLLCLSRGHRPLDVLDDVTRAV